jgi:hypothetical protein
VTGDLITNELKVMWKNYPCNRAWRPIEL